MEKRVVSLKLVSTPSNNLIALLCIGLEGCKSQQSKSFEILRQESSFDHYFHFKMYIINIQIGWNNLYSLQPIPLRIKKQHTHNMEHFNGTDND